MLLVEDDPRLASIIKTGFAENGVEVVAGANYAEGKAKATLGSLDVIVLDVMLPGEAGSTSVGRSGRRKSRLQYSC